MTCASKQYAREGAAEKSLLAQARIRMIDAIGCTMQQQRRYGQDRRGVELKLIACIARITSRMTPATAVRMQGDVCSISVVKSLYCLFKLLCFIPARRRPCVPHHAGKVAPVFTHRAFTARRGHVPLTPVIARLLNAKVFCRIVCTVGHRQHHQMVGNAWAQAASNGHRPRAPIVADQCRLLQTKYINEFQQVTPQRSKLTRCECCQASRASAPPCGYPWDSILQKRPAAKRCRHISVWVAWCIFFKSLFARSEIARAACDARSCLWRCAACRHQQ